MTPQYDNPTPVAIHLQAAWRVATRGLVLIKRADTGGWAIPGGYIENGLDQTAEGAAAREFHEETGIPVLAGQIFHSKIIPSGKLLLFVSSLHTMRLYLGKWQPTAEATDIRVAVEPEELVFPAHTEAMKIWFESPCLWR